MTSSFGNKRLLTSCGILLGIAAVFHLSVSHNVLSSSPSPSDEVIDRRRLSSLETITVFTDAHDHPLAHKQRLLLSDNGLIVVSLTGPEQRQYVQSHCASAISKLDALVQRELPHLATEVFKYCALASTPVAVYIDAVSPLLIRLQTLLTRRPSSSIAVLGNSYFPETIHGSLMVLRQTHKEVAKEMMQVLVDTSVDVLAASPLLLPRTLYAIIAMQQSDKTLRAGQMGNGWYLLEQTCSLDPLQRSTPRLSWTDTNTYRAAHHCPDKSGFCCSVYDTELQETVMMSRHPILPFQSIPNDVPRPYNAEAGHFEEDELPFISTIREQVFQKPESHPATPNFFEIMMQNDCLPSDTDCFRCLSSKKGSDCKTCAQVCACYCKALCHEQVEPKFVAKKLTVTPPLYSRDPNRLIPRIVHQTWFENLSREKYPNMSRLVESFKRSGWEYKFYSDDDAANFLSTHFPAEVRQAYDALRPGAFKADLFRYCVLLIHGGIYADVDIMLESSLDASVAPDVGFMVPVDEVSLVSALRTCLCVYVLSFLGLPSSPQPGSPVDRRMCLWNGFIAAAPGHPFLIKAIETVVNQVRNRFTGVDMDATFCPDPELSVLHAFDTLFTAGPCLLGASINRVLGRHGQTSFKSGDLEQTSSSGTAFVVGVSQEMRIPGKSIILHQNKWDMGAHRFTWLAKNLVVAATDLPDSNDRENLQKGKSSGSGGGGEHYSKTHAKMGIYGLEGLYTDKRQANEDIKVIIDASRQAMKQPTAILS